MFVQTADECAVDSNGRVIHFSVSRFISDIARGGHCFVCGANPVNTEFNDEHIIPDWILRRFDLHNRVVTLANKTPIRYGQYKIPCCVVCNTNMGESAEKPMSELFNRGHQGIREEFDQHGPWRLFSWMCRLFLKTHLKDNNLRFHRDLREDGVKIGELYGWEDLHHIHCVGRSFYTDANLEPDVLGSLIILPAKLLPYGENFDYFDLTFAQTMLLRIGDVALVTVLNDSQASQTFYKDTLTQIAGPLSPVQLREIAVRMSALNSRLVERPSFFSDIDLFGETCTIRCKPPEVHQIASMEAEVFGMRMHQVCGPIVPNMPEKPQVLEEIKTGNYSFLFNSDGGFNSTDGDVIQNK